MSTCQFTIGLTNSGSTPLGGYVTWHDEAGPHTDVPINQPYPGTPTTLMLTGVESASMTARAKDGGFTTSTKTVSCNQYTQFDLTSTSTGGCFIVTAAYGTASAPEVEFLQGFRDNVMLQTRWGRQVFDELGKYYYRISPAIAEEMIRDPEMRRVLKWAIVEPWVNYMKLMIGRPDFKAMNLDGMDPKLRAFLLQLQSDGDRWIKSIELPKSFKGRDPVESIDELNMVLGMVLLRTNGREYLDDLERSGELPLQYSNEDEAKLKTALEEAGRTEDEVASILGIHRARRRPSH